jgi:hypothetical protein
MAFVADRRAGHESHGHTFPKLTEDVLESMHGWLQGPMGHSAYPPNDPTWVNRRTRSGDQLIEMPAVLTTLVQRAISDPT